MRLCSLRSAAGVTFLSLDPRLATLNRWTSDSGLQPDVRLWTPDSVRASPLSPPIAARSATTPLKHCTADAVNALMNAGVDRVFLKIDSTMRGSVPGQVAGALAAWRTRHPDARAVVCPAYPRDGTNRRVESVARSRRAGRAHGIRPRSGDAGEDERHGGAACRPRRTSAWSMPRPTQI